MIDATNTLERCYSAARRSALAVQHEPPGVLYGAGPDRLDLFDRMSTNQLESLLPGQLRQTVFTDPVGRTVDLVTVLHEAERTVMVGLPGRAEQLRDWLQRHIFFQDQVTLELPEFQWSLWGLYGPQARAVAAEHGYDEPGSDQFTRLEGAFMWPISAPIQGVLALSSTEEIPQHWSRYGGDEPALQAYEALRIEAGIPAAGREIREDSIPLEVGLRPAIDFSKGCYVGQEIIARMDSRGQLAKQLVGLRFDGEVEPGTPLRHGDRTVGQVTSVAYAPGKGWLGLASVRSAAAQEASLRLADTDQHAALVELTGRVS